MSVDEVLAWAERLDREGQRAFFLILGYALMVTYIHIQMMPFCRD